MRYRRLGTSDLDISAVGLGSWRWWYSEESVKARW